MLKLGILGFGIVGKSALHFLQTFKHDSRLASILGDTEVSIAVWDQRQLSIEELFLIEQNNANFVSGSSVSREDFWAMCDKVLVSPGIDVLCLPNQAQKLLCELDFFCQFFSKPVIAVTGSFGKTTTTALIGTALDDVAHRTTVSVGTYVCSPKTPLRIAVGGNIGLGMLDLIARQASYDCAVLELSSWQLEHSTHFVPDIAVWTNLFPNHLDRHKTMLNYAQAKYALFAGQKKSNVAILAADIFYGDLGKILCDQFKKQGVSLILTSLGPITNWVHEALCKTIIATVIVAENDIILSQYSRGSLLSCEKIVDIACLSSMTFMQNWLQVIAVLHACKVNIESMVSTLLALPAAKKDGLHTQHRVEYFATIGGVDFYNDSKSTVVQTTQAAVEKLAAQKRPMIVILGGLHKGADRSGLVPFLQHSPLVKKVYAFGEAFDLAGAVYCATLEDVVDDVMKSIQPGDIVLLSPSGSSYDLFKNYEHRGNVFKELVLEYDIEV